MFVCCMGQKQVIKPSPCGNGLFECKLVGYLQLAQVQSLPQLQSVHVQLGLLHFTFGALCLIFVVVVMMIVLWLFNNGREVCNGFR